MRSLRGASALAAVGCVLLACAEPPTPASPASAITDAGTPPAVVPRPADPARTSPLTSPAGAKKGPTRPASQIAARHILVQWMGCKDADNRIVRTKEQARRVADAVLTGLRVGNDFARLVVEYSDEAGAAARGGALGMFRRGTMDPHFEKVAFALAPQEISGIVESPFGFHIIQRTDVPEDAPEVKPDLRAPDGRLLKIEELKEGDGYVVQPGDKIAVNYRGSLEDGTVFDTSYERHEPLAFVVGKGVVIRGWDQGVLGMKVGGKRRLTIPGSLAYGERGRPPTIPPNATLIFDVELMAINAD